MENLLQDLRYGFRSLIKTPGLFAVAVLALALGIGANSAVFSVVNSILLQPLPYAGQSRLVLVFEELHSRLEMQLSQWQQIVGPTFLR